ncbi:MAG: hypothetical protein ACXWIN_07815 [Burkholderiaceae bacterium]
MIAQIVIFKLKAPKLRGAFLEATKEMLAWLHRQPGFISYELVEGENVWSGRLVLETCDDEARGRDAFFSTNIACKILQCVDSDFRSVTSEVTAFK